MTALAASTTCRDFRRLTIVACLVLTWTSLGCRSLRGRGPVPEAVASCRALSGKGVLAIENGDLPQAARCFEQAIEACPTNAAARKEYADLLWRQGKTAQAVQEIEAAISLAPDEAPLLVQAGMMYLALGKLAAAERKAEQALQLDIQLTNAWALRGRVMRARGNSERALGDLYRALGQTPNAHDLLLDLAELHRRRGEPQRALVVLQQLAHLYSPGEEPRHVLHLTGLAQQALGRTDDAVESLYAASQRGVPSASILYHLAVAEASLGRQQAALANSRQALQVDPQHQLSRQLLARLTDAPSPYPGGAHGEIRLGARPLPPGEQPR